MILSAIVAMGENGEIGIDGRLPWPKLKKDMSWFVANTMRKTLIMGRKTYESLPFKPLGNRQIIIVTRDRERGFELIRQLDRGSRHLVDVATSVPVATELARTAGLTEESVICGGGQIYQAAMTLVHKIYLTKLEVDVPLCDTFFPYPLPDWEWDEHAAYDRWFRDSKTGIRMGFYIYTKRNA